MTGTVSETTEDTVPARGIDETGGVRDPLCGTRGVTSVSETPERRGDHVAERKGETATGIEKARVRERSIATTAAPFRLVGPPAPHDGTLRS